MKRKFANRPNWRRVLERRIVIKDIEYQDFKGCAVLITIDKIKEPLWVDVCGNMLCVADNGYSWLTLFSDSENYVVTAMFDSTNEVAQWYIDICKGHGLTEDKIPWYDDLYLDIIISSKSEINLIDQEDLEQALRNGEIDKDAYEYANAEADRLLDLLAKGRLELLNYCKPIREMLYKQLD
ncbi:MAG: hypothetical protein K0R84_2370 [Clostridia bacterium]|jgi:predicted RNA-binding protein associated with RNAse of E/G family|nr:hypothetical protein [Clostridia bacterium]